MKVPDTPPAAQENPPPEGPAPEGPEGAIAAVSAPALTGVDVAVTFLGLIGGMFLIFGGAAVFMTLLMADGSLDFRRGIRLSPSIAVNAGAFLIQALLMTAPVYFFVLRRRGLPFAAIGFKPFSRRWLFIVPLVAAVILVISEFASSLAGHPLEAPMIQALAPRGFSWFGLLVMVVVGAVLAPFAEEVFFRGVFHTWLRHRWGPIVAVIVSSLVFGLFHMQPFWIIFAAFIGVVLALLYEFSGSLWPAIGLHVINNTISIVGLYLQIA